VPPKEFANSTMSCFRAGSANSGSWRGLQFVSETPDKPEIPPGKDRYPRFRWQYGTGQVRSETGQNVASFSPFPVLPQTGGRAAEHYRPPHSGKAFSEPREANQAASSQAVIRRWVSPVSGKLISRARFRHAQGRLLRTATALRGRIVSSRHGELASGR